MSLAKKIEHIFESNFNVNLLDRHPAIFMQDPNINSVTIFDLNVEDLNELKTPIVGRVKTLKNDVKTNKSGVQRTLIGWYAANKMHENLTYALQVLPLYINNSLVELTNVLGSEIVTNKNNQLIIQFDDVENSAAIEMRVALVVNRGAV